MKDIGYSLIKLWVRTGLYFYYRKIKYVGRENIPVDKPVLFLPNHQNALLDVLLIAVNSNRKPYFLTRSDVFTNGYVTTFFNFLRMIPIYRIQDGRDRLHKNRAIFDRCGELLLQKHAILLFPEANHNLQRRVRPLSKGFTRILINALVKEPHLDIRLVPVGFNYDNATELADRVAVCYGKDIRVQDLYHAGDENGSITSIKEEVSASLKKLTTHIADLETYEETVLWLNALGVDYLNPKEVNATLEQPGGGATYFPNKRGKGVLGPIFWGLNFPMVAVWKWVVLPKVGEPEFIGTMRFMFSLLFYPVFYVLFFLLLVSFLNWETALIVILFHIVFNLWFVKKG